MSKGKSISKLNAGAYQIAGNHAGLLSITGRNQLTQLLLKYIIIQDLDSISRKINGKSHISHCTFSISHFMFCFSSSISWTEMIWWIPRVTSLALWRCTKHNTAQNAEMAKLKMNYCKRGEFYLLINLVANKWSVSFTCNSFSDLVLVNPVWTGLSFHLSFCLPVNEI